MSQLAEAITPASINYWAVLPILVVFAGALAGVLVEAFVPRNPVRWKSGPLWGRSSRELLGLAQGSHQAGLGPRRGVAMDDPLLRR